MGRIWLEKVITNFLAWMNFEFSKPRLGLYLITLKINNIEWNDFGK